MGGMSDRLTLMTVHAHPDDETITTGGIMAKYAAESVRVVCVTSNKGENGKIFVPELDTPENHARLAEIREIELARALAHLGAIEHRWLGYRDSGMMGWPSNDTPSAFWHADVTAAAVRLGALIERFRPQVVVTYDENGFYGHPDHIQAHRVTVRACEATGIPDKLYYPAVPVSAIPRMAALLAARGVEVPDDLADAPFGTPDELIGAVVDCGVVAGAKFDSLAAHASQAENIFFLSLGKELFAELFTEEAFVRARDRTGASGRETDLFAGLRD